MTSTLLLPWSNLKNEQTLKTVQGQLFRASNQTNSTQSKSILQTQGRVEQGQGELWVAFNSTCALMHETSADSEGEGFRAWLLREWGVRTRPAGSLEALESALGAVDFSVSLAAMAPAIFISGSGTAQILNEDGQLNNFDHPAQRGRPVVIFATGLGPIVRNQTQQALTIVFGDQKVSPKQVTAVSELPGLYQIHVSVPVLTAPGKAVSVPSIWRING